MIILFFGIVVYVNRVGNACSGVRWVRGFDVSGCDVIGC